MDELDEYGYYGVLAGVLAVPEKLIPIYLLLCYL
jgi:hypothetical protein